VLPVALPVERRVLARRGWAGEKDVILSITRECSFVVPHGFRLRVRMEGGL
jgi:hypothetical protein